MTGVVIPIIGGIVESATGILSDLFNTLSSDFKFFISPAGTNS